MDNIYEQLRDCIDKYSVGFVAAQSGVELKILKRLFTEDEAAVYIALTRQLESVSKIALRMGREQAEIAAILNRMTEKGHTFPATRNGIKYYAAAVTISNCVGASRRQIRQPRAVALESKGVNSSSYGEFFC